MAEVREHAGRHYAVQFHYALPDDAWCVELSEAVPAAETWAGITDAPTHLPGAAFVVAVIPEDPERAPIVHMNTHDVPYEIMYWFMEHVAQEVDRCRVPFEQGR